jgi:hypothetical protein
MANKTSRKEEITRAAIEIFGKNEFRNSSISEIAKLADIAEPFTSISRTKKSFSSPLPRNAARSSASNSTSISKALQGLPKSWANSSGTTSIFFKPTRITRGP